MSKPSKHRPCPAVGREITGVECGENRISKYSCPADCSFNPFGPEHYAKLLDLERKADEQSLAWLDQDTFDRPAWRNQCQSAARNSDRNVLLSLLVWKLYYQTDTNGLTCAQRWEKAGFPGLKNDSRVLVRAKMTTRIALLEVHRVIDQEQVEVVDLLDAQPAPFIIRDRGFASSATRFACGFTWVYALPHYHRTFGSASLLQEIGALEHREVIEAIVQHLGGPTEEIPMRRWLAEHFIRVNEALLAVGIERRRQMFANMDAKFGKAVYELKRPFAECASVLDEVQDVDRDDLTEAERREGFADARVWFAAKTDADLLDHSPIGAGAVLGRILRGQSHWRLEAMGAQNLSVFRRRFEKQLGERVHFTGERLDDLGARVTPKDPAANLSLVPPRLLENPQIIRLTTSRVSRPPGAVSTTALTAEANAAMDRDFLDHPVPALDGRTPREAARDPALRPKLIRLMKSRVQNYDQQNLESGGNYDAGWMLRELGLNEILFDPPPTGRKPRTFRLEEEDSDEANDFEHGHAASEAKAATPINPNLPPAPPLPDRPFTDDELEERLRAATGHFDTASDALHWLEASGCTLLADVGEVTEGLVEDTAFSVLVPLLLQIWFVFVPPGTRGRNLNQAELRQAIIEDSRALVAALKQGREQGFRRYLASGPQPALGQIMLGQILRLAESVPNKSRPSVNQQGVMGSVLRAVIAELDRVNR